jgi:hypothetical protein
VKDIRGTLVERHAIVNRERLSLSQCLALSVLISGASMFIYFAVVPANIERSITIGECLLVFF